MMFVLCCSFFFFKQKTAYEVRISDWSSDVCSSDLVLQPSAELDMAVQEVSELGIGSGPSSIELGLRLRYEITREFAPYIGVHYESDLFDTADFTREEGGEADAVSFVAGVRLFF